MSRLKHAYDEIYLHNEEEAWELIQERPEQFYIYVLINPLNNLPFYVGKGQGNRCFTHWNNKETSSNDYYKNNFMKKLSKKVENIYYVFELFTDDETKAYNYEATLIRKYGAKVDNGLNLLYNIKYGNGFKSYTLRKSKLLSNFEKVHGNRYDYSDVVFKGSLKISIKCYEHGSFWQSPQAHKRGQNCPECEKTRRTKTLKKFLQECFENHGEKYDYSKTVYVNSKTKVEIICKEHGSFWQSPTSHKYGHGCPVCAIINNQKSTTKTKTQFVKEAKGVHGDTYDYSKSVYVNFHTKLKIICKKHGEFLKSPGKHMSGQGCPKCK